MELAISIGPGGASEGAAFARAVSRIQALSSDDLNQVNAEIETSLRSHVAMIPTLAGHLINAGGKRLRPLLTLTAAKVFSYTGRDHVRLAAAVELIHGATLLHDDVVDGSALRRGARTANVIWGNKESVLVGDYIFSRAFELMVAVGDLRVLRILSNASGVIAEGEVLQLATQKNMSATFDMYLAVVESKTAALFAAAAQAGAVVARADDAAIEALRSFGRNLGIAYQLIDDALDYAGREAKLGKEIGDDFREGKMTLPVVYAIGRANDRELSFWRRTISGARQTPEDFAEAQRILTANNAIADTLACARRYAARALDDLKRLPPSVHLEALADLAAASVARAS